MSHFVDLTGMRFGKLTVVGLGERSNDGRIKWKCKCDCGNETSVLTHSLKSGRTTSCGCYQGTRASQTFNRHGQWGTRLYRIWSNMNQRCKNPNCDSFVWYGKKGETVCEEWQQFVPFYEWAMANGYSDNLSIDRKDNSKGYYPDNCRWATPQEQTDNRGCCRYVKYNGKCQTIKAWSKETGISYQTLLSRFNKGWDTDKALTTKPKSKKENNDG